MDEIKTYEAAKLRAEGNARLRGMLRYAVAIIVLIYLGLAYSLSYVKPGDAEYFVSILTLGLNTLLFAGVLLATLMLKKRHARYETLMRKFAVEDKANPWIVRGELDVVGKENPWIEYTVSNPGGPEVVRVKATISPTFSLEIRDGGGAGDGGSGGEVLLRWEAEAGGNSEA